jgi:hypothetical protein
MVVLITSAFLLGFSFYVGESIALKLSVVLLGKNSGRDPPGFKVYAGNTASLTAWRPCWDIGEARSEGMETEV